MTVLKCFLAGTLPIAALTLGMLSAPGLATAQASPCASEGQWCPLPAATPFWQTSYGSDNNSFVVTTENVASIPCSYVGWGDPDQGVNKRCAYMELDEDEKPAGEFKWCANEHGVCKLANGQVIEAGKYRVVRYGAGASWIYKNVSSAVDCELGKFYNWDPAPNVNKTCQISTADINPNAEVLKWKSCGGESQRCTPPTGAGRYLIKYGLGTPENGTWVYRTVVGTGIMCNQSAFGYDPAENQNKSCFYLPMSTVRSVTGTWKRLTACSGCPSGTYEYTWGVEQGNSRQSTSTFATEVATAATAGIKIEGVGEASATVTATQSFSNTESLIESYTQTAGTKQTYTCDKGALWQFQTTVEEHCGPSSPSCFTTARTNLFKCAATTDHASLDWSSEF